MIEKKTKLHGNSEDFRLDKVIGTVMGTKLLTLPLRKDVRGLGRMPQRMGLQLCVNDAQAGRFTNSTKAFEAQLLGR